MSTLSRSLLSNGNNGNNGNNSTAPRNTRLIRNPVNLLPSSFSFDSKGVAFTVDSSVPFKFNVYIGVIREISSEDCGRPVFSQEPIHSSESEGGFGCEVSCRITIKEEDQVIVELCPETNEEDPSENSEVLAQITYATAFCLTTVRQKLCCRSKHYDCLAVFGAGMSSTVTTKSVTSNSKECVICLSDDRDTIVVPCGHMCICSRCASTMVRQRDRCPLCRQKVSCYIQIKKAAFEPISDSIIEMNPILPDESPVINKLNAIETSVPTAL